MPKIIPLNEVLSYLDYQIGVACLAVYPEAPVELKRGPICLTEEITLYDLVFSAQEVLKVLPGVILLPFSLYFAYRKIGQKVSVSYSIRYSRTSAPRIGEVSITNLKDKPLTIFSMHAVIDKDIVIPVEEFAPPVVLKALESTRIETTPYSMTHIGDDKLLPNFSSAKFIEIYIISNHGSIKCKTETPPGISSITSFRNKRMATRSTYKFNDKVYNDRAKYAITYVLDSKRLTAIVDDGGFIGEDWDFQYNQIPDTHMASKEKVVDALNACGFDKYSKRFHVDELWPNHSISGPVVER